MASQQDFNVSGTHTFENRVGWKGSVSGARRVAVLMTPEEATAVRALTGGLSASLNSRLDDAKAGKQAPLSGDRSYHGLAAGQ